MATDEFDLVIIGSGPGGYVAAIRASQLGMKTAIIEKEHLGGVCLNWGCIPTKALLRTAEIYTYMQHADQFGLAVDNPRFDLDAVVKRSRTVAGQLSKGVRGLMKKNKVTVLEGKGQLAGKKGKGHAVKVSLNDGGEKTIQSAHVILATGARARTMPKMGLAPDGEVIWTAKEAMVPDKMPENLLVIGSGAIGIEFASFYRSLGAEVTVVEMVDRILPAEDEEVSAFAAKAFKKQGMKLLTGTSIEKLSVDDGIATAQLKSKEGKSSELKADRVILAIGIVGNTEDIGLETAGVKTDRGHIVVNEWLETGVPGIYAIGDVVGAPWLAHKASHEGILCVERIAGLNNLHPINIDRIPGCTYCQPQVASVGLTESEAKSHGRELKVGKFPFVGNGKAIALGEQEGFVKTIWDAKTGELLGAHMIGAEVTELIQGYSLGMTLEATEEEFFHTIYPHPTLSEMMHESALDAFDRVVHI